MLKRLSALVLLVLSTACAVKSTGPHIDPPPPPAPATFTLFAHVCDGVPCEPGNEVHKRPATDVTIDTPERTWNDGVSDPSGNRIVEGLPAGTYHVCARAQGFVLACADVTFPRPEGSDVFLVLVPDVIPVDRVHVDGKVFRDTSGAIWQYRGGTSFLLLKRYLQEGGDAIIPYIDNRRNAGANTLRVLTTVTWGPLAPTDYTDEQFLRFLALVHSRGMRLEVVALASAQDWSLERQQQHVQRIVNLVAAAGALDLVEVANEAFKNSAPPVDVMRKVTRPRPDLVLAAGGDNADCSNLTPFLLDYITFHPERKDEWPRTAKDARELRDGFDCGAGKPSYGGAHVPVVSDEPMGADEVNQPGRRSNVVDDFYWFAANASIMGAGSTFHSEAGLTSVEPGPVQAAAELAFYSGLKSSPVEAQLGQYTRGGLGNVPLAHADDKALRTFCSLQGGRADCIVIRPSTDWVAQAINGWSIAHTEGPRGTRIVLGR
jgi:hypothetical protein